MRSTLTVSAAFAVLLFTVGTASALTIANHDSRVLTVGIDEGAKEHVEKIDPGKTVTLTKECVDGCGLSGPWGFSWMAKSGDQLVYDKGQLAQGG